LYYFNFYLKIKELNDGVHWKFTLSNAIINSNEELFFNHELLHLKFNLLYASLIEDEDGVGDLLNDVDRFIPENPNFKIIATQNIFLQKITSGVHEYFPVRSFLVFIH
jgi:hypothetical protein